MNKVMMRFLIIAIGIILIISCKNKTSNVPVPTKELHQMESSINQAVKVKKLLLARADSLKLINEFEAIKIYNNLNILDENVTTLQLYIYSLSYNQDLISDEYQNLMTLALTQSEYVNSLVSSGQALLDNRSLSFGNWKNGQPNEINDSILTPVKK